jgi:hypothetical protein
MKTHAPALARKSAAPVAATPAASSMFQPRPFAKPEETEDESPKLQNRNLEKALQAKPINIPLYPPGPVVQRQPETEEEELQRQPQEEEEELQAKPLLHREAMPEEEDELKMKPQLQREAMPEEEEKLQAKPQLQREAMPEEEELQAKPQLQREAMPEEEEELQAKPQSIQLKCDECAAEEAAKQEKPNIQPKLTIGQPGDKYEQEADSMAAKVMRMPDSAVQREALPEEEDETLQAKPQLQREAMSEEDEELQTQPQLQRQAMPEEEDETVQTKPDNSKLKIENSKLPSLQAKGESPSLPANFDSQLAQHKGSGQPLSDETRAFMESRFGADFSTVRVHETPDLANAIQAQAFTHGQDIYFNSGKYNPGSSGGKELLAHELTHVVQQSRPKSSMLSKLPQKANSQPPLKDKTNAYNTISGKADEGNGDGRFSVVQLKLDPANTHAWNFIGKHKDEYIKIYERTLSASTGVSFEYVDALE